MSCSTGQCGVGGWGGPLPGDPSNNSILSAIPTFGGIDVSWTYPTTRPEAVAYVLLYRSTSSDFTAITQLATVAGSTFYDRNTSSVAYRYYYWIRFISVNGTEGELIGPASAVSSPTVRSVIDLLSGEINQGMLATSLKTDIAKIDTNHQAFLDETLARLATDNAFSRALAEVQSGVQGAMTFLSNEITQRRDGDSALLSQVNTLFAANRANTALLTNSYYTKVETDAAISVANTSLLSQARTEFPTIAHLSNTYLTKASTEAAISTATLDLISTTALNEELGNYASTAQLRNTMATYVGYAALRNTSSAFDGDGTTVIYPASLYPSADYPEYANNRYRIIDSIGVGRWNATAAGIATPLQWIVGLPLATAINAVQITDPTTGLPASVQVAMLAQKTLNDGLKAQYTIRVVNGLIGGFGIYNNGETVEAGFDVDKFWVGSSTGSTIKPFIIDNGKTYINDAAIGKITFDKLADSTGALIFENGKLKADYINVTKITGGSFTDYAWTNNQSGFYLGPGGLLLGNYNSGKYLQYDTTYGTFNLNGKIIADNTGKVIADLVDIRRRAVAETGITDYGIAITVPGRYLHTEFTENGSTSYEVSYPVGAVIEVSLPEYIVSNITDPNIQNTVANQPYYVAMTAVDGALRNWIGPGGFTCEISIFGTTSITRSFSNTGVWADDYRLIIKPKAYVKIKTGSFTSFTFPPIKWTVYKL